MKPRLSIAILVLAASLPAGVRADDWQQGYAGDESSGGSDGYDVSVDLDAGGVTPESFQAPLAPYGEWVVAGSYGQVWRPRVATGWRPYYYGRWEWTHEGWLWASDEPWGWATYHYGRWAYDSYYGWIWVPGYEWAPAWVSWRTSGDVIGWAPLAPGLSVYVSAYPFVDFWWTFVPTVRFVSVPVYTVAYAPSYARRWFNQTAPAPARPAPRPGVRMASPSPAWGGPAPRLIAERTGRPLAPARIVAVPSPGARARPGEIPVYRPEARSASGRGPGAFPAPRAGREGGWAPPAREGRGPGAFPAPARGGREGSWAPPEHGGRGPGAVPAPGRGGERVFPPPQGQGRGPGPAPAPGAGRGNDGRDDRGDTRAPPEWRSEPRGGSSPPPARGGGARGDPRAPEAPAPRRGR